MLKKSNYIFFIIFTIFLNSNIFAHSGGGKMERVIGPDKAIMEYDKKKGIKFSKEAISTLNLRLHKITSNKNEFRIPKEGLIQDQNQYGIYIYKNGFFRLIFVDVLGSKQQEKTILVRPKVKIAPGAKVLGKNANLVHVSIIYLKHT